MVCETCGGLVTCPDVFLLLYHLISLNRNKWWLNDRPVFMNSVEEAETQADLHDDLEPQKIKNPEETGETESLNKLKIRFCMSTGS